MSDSSMDKHKKRRSWWWKIPAGLLLLMAVCLVAAMLFINSIALSQINQALDRYLTHGGTLDAIDIRLFRGRAVLNGLTINQPEDYGTNPLLNLNTLEVEVDLTSILGEEIIVEQVVLKGMTATLVRNKQGVVSPIILPAPVDASPGKTAKTNGKEQPPKIPKIRVQSIRLENISIHMIDQMAEGQWSSGLRLDMTVDDLYVKDLLNQDLLTGKINVALNDIKIDQPAGFSKTPLLTLGQVEVATPGVDLTKGHVPVSKVLVSNLKVSVERNPKGVISVLQLINAWMPEASASEQPKPAKQPPSSGKQAPVKFKLPTLAIEEIQLKAIALQVLDHTREKPWRAGFDNLDMRLNGLEVEDVEQQAVSLKSSTLNLKGIRIDQPAGFGKTPLLTLDQIAMATPGFELAKGRVPVSKMLVSNLSASVERSSKGVMSINQLIDAWRPETRASQQPKSTRKGTSSNNNAHAVKLPTLALEDVQINAITLQVLDHTLNKPWRAGFDNMDIRLKGLEVGDIAKQALSLKSSVLNLKGIRIDQPAGFGKTPLLTLDQIALSTPGFELAKGRVPVSKVLVSKLAASVERNQKGVFSINQLIDTWIPETSASQQPKTAEQPPSSGNDGPETKLPILALDDVAFNAITLQVLDHTLNKPWRAGFDNLDIRFKGLEVGDMAKHAISLKSSVFKLQGVKIDQPAGFGKTPLLTLKHLGIDSNELNPDSRQLAINQVQIQGLESSIIVNNNGLSNLARLNQILLSTDEETDRKKVPESEPDKTSPGGLLPKVRVETIHMENSSFTIRDESFSEPALMLPMNNIHMEATGLRLFDENVKTDPARASISFEMVQPADLPKSLFGCVAVLGPVGSGVPSANSQVRLTGFKLDTLGTLVPPATRTALGATGFDSDLTIAVDSNAIDLNASILTDKGIHYNAISVKGPVNDPKVKIESILAGAFNRVSKGMANLGIKGLDAGVSIAEGGVDVVKDIGSGTVKLGENLGKSAIHMTKGILTLDHENTTKGLKGATQDTIGITAGSVSDSGSSAGGALKQSTSSLKDDARVKAWDDKIYDRHKAEMQRAKKELSQMPYPPVMVQGPAEDQK